MNEHKVVFKLHTWINDKLIVFSRPKIATRILDTYFNYNNCFDVTFELSSAGIEITNVHHQNHQEGLSNQTKAKDVLNNFLKGKDKRDVFIFYRDPHKRFISGVYQEFLSSVTNVEHFYFMTKNMKDRLEVFQLLNKVREATFTFEKYEVSEKLEKQINELITDYVIFMVQNKINLEHTNNHLQVYNLILTMCDVNESKIKIINSEITDIEPLLKPYFIDTKWKKGEGPPFNFKRNPKDNSIIRQQFSNENIKMMVSNVIRDNGNLPALNKVSDIVQEYLTSEYAAFYFLQSHKRNISNITVSPQKKSTTRKKV